MSNKCYAGAGSVIEKKTGNVLLEFCTDDETFKTKGEARTAIREELFEWIQAMLEDPNSVKVEVRVFPAPTLEQN